MRNRIQGHGLERPDQLLANPLNWRTHPARQRKALAALLDDVGWVQRVIVNKGTGHIIDGHLRVEIAEQRGELVPVTYVDLQESEEALVLAALDPIGAMAGTDSAKLAEVLAEVSTTEPDLMAFLAELGGPAAEPPKPQPDKAKHECPACGHRWD